MFKPILQHLRFPFSLLLLPVYLFGVFETKYGLFNTDAMILFVILHLLVYPSSNAYNSLQDKDEGSIGLVKHPFPPPPELSWVTLLLDIIAIASSCWIHPLVSIGIFVYILFSRLYSYRAIRLKQYPYVGFLTVFIFQGAWIFLLTQFTLTKDIHQCNWVQAITASCLIGAVYPLSQIYQHEQDLKDGVKSISAVLGHKGTFIFSGLIFLLGTNLFCFNHFQESHLVAIKIFLAFQFPVTSYFLYWAVKVWRNQKFADYKHTMQMNLIACLCMNCCFILLSYLSSV